MPFNIENNGRGYHIYFTHRNIFLIFVLFVLPVILILAVVGYQYYMLHYYDSSTSRKELADLKPQSPPPEIKNKLKDLIAQKLKVKEASPAAITTQPFNIPILMYHYIEYIRDKNDKTRITLTTFPSTLENQIITLLDAGYTFMTTKDIADVLNGQMKLPAKPIALTFDDGYRDFYTDAYPILKKYHVKATEYVISGFIGRPNHLLKSQILEIAQDGLVEIGAHTVYHRWLKSQSARTVSDEVFQSRVALQQLTGGPVVSFAYPFGAFDSQAVEIVQAAGFQNAVSTLPGVTLAEVNRYYMFRLRPGGRTGKYLLKWLSEQK